MKNFPVELRVAVASGCQMRCVYCPTSSFENYTPTEFKGIVKTHDQFLKILLTLLKANSFRKVSLTGGEPLLNSRLHEIVKAIKVLVPRIELNTNGLLLNENKWKLFEGLIDQVKISIDTLNAALFSEITKINGHTSIDKIIRAIEILKKSGDTEVVLNTVLMRNNFEYIFELINYVKSNELRLHILDYNFTEETRVTWNNQFIPSEQLISKLTDIYGHSSKVERIGAGYFEFYPGRNSVVRIRSSFYGTFRTSRCDTCSHYCQTGIFGLMLSTDGWLTTCQASYDQRDGVLLTPEMSVIEIQEKIGWLIKEISDAKYKQNSFQLLVEKQQLIPKN